MISSTTLNMPKRMLLQDSRRQMVIQKARALCAQFVLFCGFKDYVANQGFAQYRLVPYAITIRIRRKHGSVAIPENTSSPY